MLMWIAISLHPARRQQLPKLITANPKIISHLCGGCQGRSAGIVDLQSDGSGGFDGGHQRLVASFRLLYKTSDHRLQIGHLQNPTIRY